MNSKYLLISLTLIGTLFFSSNNFTDDPGKNNTSDKLPYQTTTIDSKQMDGNSINTWFRNNGSFNRNPFNGNGGFTWSVAPVQTLRYASGLWISAKVGNDTLVVLAEYDYEYLPGYIDNNGNPQGKDDPLYRIYKINRGDTTSYDYLHWPVDQGAYLDTAGKPFLPGVQTMFMCYSDGYPESHNSNGGETLPLKAQIQVTNWEYNYNQRPEYILNNTIFSEFKIINKNNLPWNEAYISIWSDEMSSEQVAIGCDTLLKTGYSYYNPNGFYYGNSPPSLSFTILKGLEVYTGNVNDTVYSFIPGQSKRNVKTGFKEIKFSTFHTYRNADPINGDPSNFRETYLMMQGFKRNGENWFLPGTNIITHFPYSGDPETNTGWVQWTESGFGNRRLMLNIGPLNVNPGDTQTIVFAQIIARGSNNLNSVTKLKQSARTVQRLFDNNFNVSVSSPLPVTTSYASGNGKIYLSWDDLCEKASVENKLSGGMYKFQGYNVYRIRPNNTNPGEQDTILLKTFDIKDGIKNIRDSIYINSYEGIVYGIVQRGSDNGISRYIVLEKDTVSGNPFINGTEYKFAVTAYFYDPSGGIYTLPKVYESPVYSNIIRVIPQDLTSGTSTGYFAGDTLATNQKDLSVMPVVMDPLKLVNADYASVFGKTDSVLSWTLTKTVNGITSVIFENEKNFYGQDSAKTFDGILFAHQMVKDSGIVRDPDTFLNLFNYTENLYYEYRYPNNRKAWSYEPAENLWIEGPDTQAVKTAKVITGRQYDSRSIGMSFPTTGTFKNSRSKIFAGGKKFTTGPDTNKLISGGPLRKIQIVFGQNSQAYRFVPTDTNLTNAPYANMVTVPFSVFAVDDLDSGAGHPRQINTGFLDTDSNGIWDPDTSKLGKYHFTYIFVSDYNTAPIYEYTIRNPGLNSPARGFTSMDIMYVWHPRVKRSSNGVPLAFTNGDKLTVTPYRITRSEFVPGYPVKYSLSVTGTEFGNFQTASTEVEKIKAFPNPYYGTSELEYDSGGEKFICFSHLPQRCDIYIYTLNGSLVRKTQRNVNDPSNTLEKWDLRNSGGSMVASGMYIVYVDCKELGTKTLKIAVFTMK